jgi:hypothetical protein
VDYPHAFLAESVAVDRMVGVLAQHQGGAGARRENVLDEVGPVDRMPDVAGREHRLLVGQRRVVMEVRLGVGERTCAHRQEARDVPTLDVLDAGVDVDREVEEVRHHQGGAGLEHVETLENEDVGVLDDHLLAGDDVIEQMRIHRRAHLIGSRFDRRDEPHQPAAIVALRKTFAVHEVSPRQFGVRVEEAVGGDEVDAGMVLPPRQQRLQHAGRRGLADGDAARHPDDERHRAVGILLRLAEEFGGGREQSLARGHLQMDEPGQRQIDLFDFQQVQLFAEAAKSE